MKLCVVVVVVNVAIVYILVFVLFVRPVFFNVFTLTNLDVSKINK